MKERLAEEVRKNDHLYNPSLTEYKDTQMACNSWKDISANVGLQFNESLTCQLSCPPTLNDAVESLQGKGAWR
ncbi:unnamed protein product, partial [Pleuronectes platessa]